MSTLLKAKQLVLLIQDGFRALGGFAPNPDLIATIHTELQQLKSLILELDLPEISILVEKLLSLLALIPKDYPRSLSIYSSENLQIIFEALRVIANRLAETKAPDNISIPDLASVLDMLHQQKSITSSNRIEPSNETIVESTKEIISGTEPLAIASESVSQTSSSCQTEPVLKETNIPQTALPNTTNNHQNESYLILYWNSQLLAIPAQSIERLMKLSLVDLKLKGNDILANIEGNEIPIYDLTTIFGSDAFAEPIERETFQAVILNTEHKRIGLLFDAVFGLRNLAVTKFQSVLGKIKGVTGIAALPMEEENLAKEQPVFVLQPTEL